VWEYMVMNIIVVALQMVQVTALLNIVRFVPHRERPVLIQPIRGCDVLVT